MIKWSRKVPQHLITRLYNQSVSGIHDNDLVDEVGYALYARCESIISVTYGYERKTLICPDHCGADVALADGVFGCLCGFHATWDEFRRSYKDKQLYAANALPIFLAFSKDFPSAKTYGEKLICIDVLIHSFHIKNSYHRELGNSDPYCEDVEVNRPAAANLIEGSLKEVILFLDNLSAMSDSQEKVRWQNTVQRANGGDVLRG